MRRTAKVRRTTLKLGTAVGLVACAALLCFATLPAAVHAAAATPYISVAPTKGPVGSNMIITGTGLPASEPITLNWITSNTTWAVGLNIPQGDTNVPEVNGVNSVPWTYKIASTSTNSSGDFTATVKVPTDDNGQKVIQVVGAGFNSTQAEAVFVVEPHFTFSPTSGPPGTPITVTATGLGNRLYAAEYHVLWDNSYIGYMTGVTTHGNGNFTFYATGAPGLHAVTIYNGYPGPAFMNSQQAPASVQITSYDPPLIPFHGNFTVTSTTSAVMPAGQGLNAGAVFSLLALGVTLTAVASTPILARPGLRRGLGRTSAVAIVIVAIALAGFAVALIHAPATSTNTVTDTATIDQTATNTLTVTSTLLSTTTVSATGTGSPGWDPSTPASVTLRPVTTITPTEATTGPRITVTPDVATVGTLVNVTGVGFAAGAALPLTWSTHVGSHVTGFSSSTKSLKNVTANSAGAFSFMMHLPADLEGIHNIYTTGSTDTQANGTVYIERVASISANSGPIGSKVVITLMGTGWDYQDNMVAVDYDNSYIGYGCGFNENGNITITLTVYGAPGFHTIDLWPSFYLGPPAGDTIAIFRYPMLTPYDGPEGIPAFHFAYFITGNSTTA